MSDMNKDVVDNFARKALVFPFVDGHVWTEQLFSKVG